MTKLPKEYRIYCDDKNVIIDIGFENDDNLNRLYKTTIISYNQADKMKEYIDVWFNKPQRRAPHVLYEKQGKQYTKRITFVYYDKNDKSIICISPRKNEIYDNKENTNCGVIDTYGVVMDLLRGIKSTNNFKVICV